MMKRSAVPFARAVRQTALRLGEKPSTTEPLSRASFSFRRSYITQGAQTTPRPRPGPKPNRTQFLGLTLVASGLACSAWLLSRDAYAEQGAKEKKIRLSEVHKHDQNAETFWVVRGTRVYDITDWVPNHPGGDVILRAAGGNIDQYWDIFSIHQKQDVYEVLEQYFIGVVDPRDLVDGKVPADKVADPFATDPKRDKRLRVLSSQPCNAETPESELLDYITPNDVFYIRNHLWVPQYATAEDYELIVELFDGEEKAYTLKDLQKFPQHTVTAVLQCSGNRRSHMSAESRQTQGLAWGVGAIGNAEWTGVMLRDVLMDAGFPVDDLPEDVKHAQFSGSEAYGASIPIEKAVDKRGDVLLAMQMNGKPLPPDHGYPVRVLVPGHVAARSVKWVQKITMSDEESTSQWQRRDYKCFGPNQDSNVDWDSAPAIQEMPVQSAITRLRELSPKDSKSTSAKSRESDGVELEGYAFSGGGRRIIRVDVSADDGKSWRQAELVEDESKGYKAWGWTRWRIAVPKSQAGRWFTVKAVDDAYQTQPETHESTWNFRGNLASAWQRIRYERPE